MAKTSELFAALSDSTRRQIIKKLQERDMTPGELLTAFTITKPTLTHHLKTLKHAGLVTVEKKGQFRIYSLNVSVLEEVAALLFEIFHKK